VGVSRAETDAADSFMLADLLRTDGRRLQVLAPTERATLDLQALSRQSRQPGRDTHEPDQPVARSAGSALARRRPPVQ
jgi:hypothetical protein